MEEMIMDLRKIVREDPLLFFEDNVLKYSLDLETEKRLASFKIRGNRTLQKFLVCLEWFDRKSEPGLIQAIEIPALQYIIRRYIFHNIISDHQARNLAIALKATSKLGHVL
jgi:hypothetical protein